MIQAAYDIHFPRRCHVSLVRAGVRTEFQVSCAPCRGHPRPALESRPRRGGRAVECTGLENQQGLIALRGFKSHPLRHIKRSPAGAFFVLRQGDVDLNSQINTPSTSSIHFIAFLIPSSPCSSSARGHARFMRKKPSPSVPKSVPL